MNDKLKLCLRILFIVIVLWLFFFTFMLFFQEYKLNYDLRQELKANNATCKLERGIFNMPLMETCTYSVIKGAKDNGNRNSS